MPDQRLQSRFLALFLPEKWRNGAFAMLALALVLASAVFAFTRLHQTYADQATAQSLPGDWSTYMYNAGRSGYNQSETIITRSVATHLKLHWTISSGGKIFSQPIVANGMIYWGSFDGYEHAANLSGQQIWQQNLGAATSCVPYNPLGVVSSATVATVPINGQATSVVFVGGGDDHLYALNAATGAIIWRTPIGNPSTNTFIWDSPLVIDNSVYIGSATTGESSGCKLIAGQFFKLDPSTGSIQNTFNSVPAGCVGGGIWSSPSYDASDDSIYFTGGTAGGCKKDVVSIGIVKLRASDLSFVSSWQIPLDQRLTHDADFAGTPTLFTATINGVQKNLVGAEDKNGVFYAFNRASLSSGPVWSVTIATAGPCPQCGNASISSAIWDGSNLYVASSSTTINGVACGGSVRSLDPANGNFIWQTCLKKTIMGPISEIPGVLAVIQGGNGSSLILLNTTTGAKLFTHAGSFYGSPSISNGVLYAGSTIGELYAFGK